MVFVSAAEELGLGTTLPTAPTDLAQYPKLCELRRKFPVLYRVEFQVRDILYSSFLYNINNYTTVAAFEIRGKLYMAVMYYTTLWISL